MKGFRSNHEYIIITCNTDFVSAGEEGKETLTLYQWITAQFTDELIKIAQANRFEMEHAFDENVEFKHLLKAINTAATRMKDEELDDVKRAKVLLGLMKGPTFSKRLIDWFEKYQPDKKITVVIDNLDCYSHDQRAECFANILPVLTRHNIKIVVPLRFETELDDRGALFQYSQAPKKFPLDMPVFKHILNLRLTKLPPGVTVKDHTQTSRQILQSIWDSFSGKDAVTLFNGLFGANTRQKLEVFKEALKSFHFNSQDDYKSKEKFIEMLMLDEYFIALPDFSRMLNIFDQGSRQGYQNTLARIRVLQCIRMSGNNLALEDKTTIPELGGAYEPVLLHDTINALIKHGLVEISGVRGMRMLPPLQKRGPQIALTHSGSYYLSHLLSNKTYVTLCAQSSLIPESVYRKENGISVCKRIQELLLLDEGLNELANRLWKDWSNELFVPLEDFIKYIANEEEQESQKLSDKDFVSAISLSTKMREDFLASEPEEAMKHI